MQTYEYGVVYFTFTVNETGYRYDSHQGVGNDLAGIAWEERKLSNRTTAYYVSHPAVVANHLGAQGWEPFHVGQQSGGLNVVLQYHFRRASEDRPAAR